MNQENTTLADRFIPESEGIAVWALEGLHRLISNGRFTMPETTLNELDYMVESGSPVTRFIDEECVFEQTERVADNALWSRYGDWCRITGMDPMKRKNFMQAFKDASMAKGSRSSKSIRIEGRDYRGFYGVNVKPVVSERNVMPLAAVV
jgi:putative DNA primase/helicase